MTESHAEPNNFSEANRAERRHIYLNITRIERPGPVVSLTPAVLKVASTEQRLQYEQAGNVEAIKSPKSHRSKHFLSIVAEHVVGAMLYEDEIPSIRNPIFYHEKGKIPYHGWDYRTPVGTLDVKAVDYGENRIRLTISKERHDNAIATGSLSDVTVAVKFLQADYQLATLRAFAFSSDIRQTFHQAVPPDFVCPDEPCYWELLENLHEGLDLWNALKQCRKLGLDEWGPTNLRTLLGKDSNAEASMDS